MLYNYGVTTGYLKWQSPAAASLCGHHAPSLWLVAGTWWESCGGGGSEEHGVGKTSFFSSLTSRGCSRFCLSVCWHLTERGNATSTAGSTKQVSLGKYLPVGLFLHTWQMHLGLIQISHAFN